MVFTPLYMLYRFEQTRKFCATFFVLDLGLDVLDGIAWLDLEGDGLPRESLDEDLHSSSQPQDEMKSGLLLDVVVRKCAAILELLACEDEPLLIRRNTYKQCLSRKIRAID